MLIASVFCMPSLTSVIILGLGHVSCKPTKQLLNMPIEIIKIMICDCLLYRNHCLRHHSFLHVHSYVFLVGKKSHDLLCVYKITNSFSLREIRSMPIMGARDPFNLTPTGGPTHVITRSMNTGRQIRQQWYHFHPANVKYINQARAKNQARWQSYQSLFLPSREMAEMRIKKKHMDFTVPL
jgi:hypothetical protein